MTKNVTYDGMSGAEFTRAVGADVDRWTDAGMEAAKRHGMTVEREWLRSLLDDAMDAARRFGRPVLPKPTLYWDPVEAELRPGRPTGDDAP